MNEKKEQSRDERMTWKKGDVKIFDSVEEYERISKSEGYEIVKPKRQRNTKK